MAIQRPIARVTNQFTFDKLMIITGTMGLRKKLPITLCVSVLLSSKRGGSCNLVTKKHWKIVNGSFLYIPGILMPLDLEDQIEFLKPTENRKFRTAARLILSNTETLCKFLNILKLWNYMTANSRFNCPSCT